jgi:hypothetical protein
MLVSIPATCNGWGGWSGGWGSWIAFDGSLTVGGWLAVAAMILGPLLIATVVLRAIAVSRRARSS